MQENTISKDAVSNVACEQHPCQQDTPCMEEVCLPEGIHYKHEYQKYDSRFTPEIPNLRAKSNITYATARAIEYLKQGIGKSRRFYKKFVKKVPYIHAYETLTRYAGVFNNFKDTVLIPSGVTMLHKITTNHIDTHFNRLLEGDCSEKTISVNASALIKFLTAFGRYDLVDYIYNMRLEWRKKAHPSSRTQPFINPEKVIQAMRRPYQEGAIIQYLTGARVSDIRKVYEWLIENPDATVVTIKNSKGGRNRTIDYSERPRTLSLVKDAVERLRRHFKSDTIDWLRYMKEYTDEVRGSARKCNETYCGTHAFRVNYADNRYEELSVDDNDILEKREEKILSIITEDLGHSRLSMAKYYLSTYR